MDVSQGPSVQDACSMHLTASSWVSTWTGSEVTLSVATLWCETIRLKGVKVQGRWIRCVRHFLFPVSKNHDCDGNKKVDILHLCSCSPGLIHSRMSFPYVTLSNCKTQTSLLNEVCCPQSIAVYAQDMGDDVRKHMAAVQQLHSTQSL